ncbi:hypothetical protein PC118_g12199 [Phytophthora cactorum]|uniref:Uncharacterized protein n=1 Tax=Phytophthora cactorum TaxID=29920 RepID=A0A8T1C507_9STRA|nr:hypothetical protein PC111_g8817 [Phytophthora cactorum]KAG2850732.1 hypothetical protein PC113_g16522 [Phytophthora cactorum]KAG2914638.1 hypothetical protein PC115_g11627 [Phytophthora cactorum]KAG2917019.1 hypothetical protein PC117_g17563 [Phytophthora cactorum]KAG2978570.1 hypothetical protein PC118_g12199 [Phytophthora cactorum]
MMATTNKSSNSTCGFKREAEPVTNEHPAKRVYYGKCQYKTGKCFNERTLKRNGEAHSLCEEHRVKQNLIQRRSDRKYQTVHAIRRRERSQRRAVLKKQVSMAVAQQLFYEHQQQKTLGIPLPQHHPLHMLAADANGAPATPSASGFVGLAPPIQVPTPAFVVEGQSAASQKDESSPTGIDNFTPDPFLTIPMSSGGHSMPALRDDEIEENSSLGDSFGYMPIVSCTGDKETWSDDDIKFLQTILLA